MGIITKVKFCYMRLQLPVDGLATPLGLHLLFKCKLVIKIKINKKKLVFKGTHSFINQAVRGVPTYTPVSTQE